MKKGFTLVELLVVLVIVGALAMLILPGLLGNYTKALAKIMKTEENLITDAATLAIKDYCNNPIKPEYRATKCISDTGGILRNEGTMYYVCVEDLRDAGYYDNDLVYEKTECRATTVFEKNQDNKFVNPKTYIFCGEDFDLDYTTDPEISEYDFIGCGLARE